MIHPRSCFSGFFARLSDDFTAISGARSVLILAVLAMIFLPAILAHPQQGSDSDLTQTSLEDLMNINVTSVSK
jgi:ATP-dependent exoDNAse (exonuclease V) alpha subunit